VSREEAGAGEHPAADPEIAPEIAPEIDLAASLRAATAVLARAGVGTPQADAEALAAHALGVRRGELLRLAALGAPAPRALAGLLAARAERVPLQHLTGTAGFRRLELQVGPGVFVPRPETEVVAGEAIAEVGALVAADPRHHPLVVDLCTGSAAIALAVATEAPAARVVALELDLEAMAWARRNVDTLAPEVDLRAGDVRTAAWEALADLVGEADVVVSNPPYIPEAMVPTDVEVREHDPALAVWGGGEDGLGIPRAVVAAAALLLRPGGLLVMEHADVQGEAAVRLAAAPAWQDARTIPDLTGRPRAMRARRS